MNQILIMITYHWILWYWTRLKILFIIFLSFAIILWDRYCRSRLVRLELVSDVLFGSKLWKNTNLIIMENYVSRTQKNCRIWVISLSNKAIKLIEQGHCSQIHNHLHWKKWWAHRWLICSLYKTFVMTILVLATCGLLHIKAVLNWKIWLMKVFEDKSKGMTDSQAFM